MNEGGDAAEPQLDVLSDGSVVSYKSSQSRTCLALAVSPNIICFHGSGETATESWTELVKLLSKDHSLILLDRGSCTSSVEDHIRSIRQYLCTAQVVAPYILLAHSYGGTFAKQFLLQHSEDVAGIVLVETGKSQDPRDKAGYPSWNAGKGRLGAKPLVVIRGDSLGTSRLAVDALENATKAGAPIQSMLLQRRQMLTDAEKQDEGLEKAQLQLSSRNRYVHLPDCGHNVIRDRPDVVVSEVQWIMENLQARNEGSARTSRIWCSVGHLISVTKSWRDRSLST